MLDMMSSTKVVSWINYRAKAAERLTGMPVHSQLKNRERGQLLPVGEGERALLDGVAIAEMLFIRSLSALTLGKLKTNLTIRSKAAEAIAFWAVSEPKAIRGVDPADAEDAARKLLGVAKDRAFPTHLIVPPDAETWRDAVWTNDPAASLKTADAVMVVIDLQRLGKLLAGRAKNDPLAEVKHD